MAPAPSHSSSSRDVAAGSRTFTHHESTVSSLHRIAEANVAVGGLRNTYDIYIYCESPCPTPIAQRKQTSLVGKAFETREHSSTSAFQIHRHVLPPSHSSRSTQRFPSKLPLQRSQQNQAALVEAHQSSRCQASSVDAFKTRTLAGLHRASDLTHSIFLQLTMYADPLAGRV